MPNILENLTGMPPGNDDSGNSGDGGEKGGPGKFLLGLDKSKDGSDQQSEIKRKLEEARSILPSLVKECTSYSLNGTGLSNRWHMLSMEYKRLQKMKTEIESSDEKNNYYPPATS